MISMGKSMNLNNLTPEEAEQILRVIQKDFELRQKERERLRYPTIFAALVRVFLTTRLVGKNENDLGFAELFSTLFAKLFRI
ncbi:hypothetical protein DPMN_084894 [Dreissena polymorpha]|uniref:Uncharacterized protein n=1 Tax=Dreissena polymorpha TaxID=45954 RepID=A0A9D3YBD8_DREPO|nr:hypothetical protein DPMN_084894 [Dreissena polymorpha]